MLDVAPEHLSYLLLFSSHSPSTPIACMHTSLPYMLCITSHSHHLPLSSSHHLLSHRSTTHQVMGPLPHPSPHPVAASDWPDAPQPHPIHQTYIYPHLSPHVQSVTILYCRDFIPIVLIIIL